MPGNQRDLQCRQGAFAELAMEISLLLSASQSVSSETIPIDSTASYDPLSSDPSDKGLINPDTINGFELYGAQADSFSKNPSAGVKAWLASGQTFFFPPNLGRVEKKAPKPFRCVFEGCNATFGQKGSLTRHVKSRHEKLRPHSCNLCQKSFSALWTLRVHQRNVHLKSKPHKCHLCDKSFGEFFNKSKHIAIVHEGKRPFSCPICSRAFGYKGDMRKHVLELHEQSGRPFQCMVPSCGVKFARRRYLRRHENLSHKGQTIPQSDAFLSPMTPPPMSRSGGGQSPGLFSLGASIPIDNIPEKTLNPVDGEDDNLFIESQDIFSPRPTRWPLTK